MLHVLALGCAGSVDFSGGGDGVDPDSVVYRPVIQDDLVRLGCLPSKCHGAPGTGLTVLPAPANEDEWLANYEQVIEEAASGLLWEKPTGAVGHPTDDLDQDDPTLLRWRDWYERGAPFDEDDN